RVAFLSFSNFGSREIDRIDRIRKAIRLLDAEKVEFEFDGETQADIALDYELLRETYPFCRLTGPANVLVMPGLHSAHISSRLIQKLGGVTVIGPVIDGLENPVQIVQMGATVSDLVNHAALAAYGALSRRRKSWSISSFASTSLPMTSAMSHAGPISRSRTARSPPSATSRTRVSKPS